MSTALVERGFPVPQSTAVVCLSVLLWCSRRVTVGRMCQLITNREANIVVTTASGQT